MEKTFSIASVLKYSIGLSLVFFNIFGAFAQDVPPPQNQSYAAGAYVPGFTVNEPFLTMETYSEDLHHGQLNVGLPLHTLKSNAISLPVSIAYNTGGIKVAEIADRVGLGWHLNAGGFIRREIKGRNDGIPQRTAGIDPNINPSGPPNPGLFFNNGTGSDPTVFGTLPAADKALICKQSYEKSYDTEPDIYHFNFAGNAGKIIFDVNKIPHIISKQNIQVFVNFDAVTKDIKSWKLVTEDGTQYIFATTESDNYQSWEVQYLFGTTPSFIPVYRSWTEGVYKWYLDQIKSPTGNNTIDLTYDSPEAIYYTSEAEVSFMAYVSTNVSPYIGSPLGVPPINTGLPIPGGYPAVNKSYQKIVTRILPKRISKISSLSSVVTFNYNIAGRSDLQGDHSLQSVTIKSSDNASVATKAYNFAYNYSHKSSLNNPAATYECYRLQLVSVTEVANGVYKRPYSFIYNQAYVLPARNDLQFTDHWGYYNNTQANNGPDFVPALQYMNPLFTAQGTLNFGGVNKVSPIDQYGGSCMSAGILLSINYPTGGASFFDYEANSYHDFTTASDQYVGGLRIRKLIKYSHDGTNNIERNYTYTYPGAFSLSSGSIGELPKYHYEKKYSTPAAAQSTSLYLYYYYLVGFPTPVVETGTTNGSHIGYSSVTVSEAGKGSTVYEFTSFGDHPDLPNTNTVGTFTSVAQAAVGAPKYGTINLNPTPAISQAPTSIYLPSTNMEMERGLLLSETVYDNNGNIQKKTSNTYNYTDPDQKIIYGLRTNGRGIFPGFISAKYECSANNGTGPACLVDNMHKTAELNYDYYLSLYPLNDVVEPTMGFLGFYTHISKRVNFTGTTVEVYDQVNTSSKFPAYNAANKITNSITYSYLTSANPSTQPLEIVSPVVSNPAQTYHKYNYQLRRHTNTASDGRIITTTYTYPRDYSNNISIGNPSINVGVTALQNSSQNNVKVETIVTEQLTDGSNFVLSGEINDFHASGLLKSKSLLEIQTPLNITNFSFSTNPNSINGYTVYIPHQYYKLRQTYDAYDDADNLTQTTKANDLPNAILWGQNKSYIVAKAPNVKSSQIAFSGFEGPYAAGSATDGNVSFTTPTFSAGRTGNYCTNSGANIGPLPAGLYKIGFWAKYNQVPANASYNVSIARQNQFAGNVDLNALRTSNTWTYFETVIGCLDNMFLGIAPMSSDNGQLLIDDLSLCPGGVFMNTYVYKPLVGIVAETDANRVTIYYEYDELNRLKIVRDQDNNIRSKTTYNYKQ